jgi:hypothetical protein
MEGRVNVKFYVLSFVWKTEENHEGISMDDVWVEI